MVFEHIRDLVGLDTDGPAIAVEDLTETFRLYHERPGGLKERLMNPGRARTSYTDFDALKDVSFTIEHGESVGIIGHNGAGKSTLLKVLSKILPPDGGQVALNGRVASLLELGAGFHGDLTGRENIYLNGAILGLTQSEIDERFDDIVDFAEVRPFLDTPVRNYSSGMYVRLGFAIAVHVDPDILLVDEILSVGDAEFQEKSLARMVQFRERGKTVLFVSHDLAAVHELADRVLVMRTGQIVFDGNAREGIRLYTQTMGTGAASPPEEARGVEPGRGRVAIEQVELLDADGVPATEIAPSSWLRVRVHLCAHEGVEACSVGVNLLGAEGRSLYEMHTSWQGLGVGPLPRGGTATVDIALSAHVLAGRYRVTTVVTDPAVREEWAVWPDVVAFEVKTAPGGAGVVDMEASTAVSEGPALRLAGDATGPVRIESVDEADPDRREAPPAESATG